MLRRCVQAAMVVLLLAAAGFSLGACEPRWGHVKHGVSDIF